MDKKKVKRAVRAKKRVVKKVRVMRAKKIVMRVKMRVKKNRKKRERESISIVMMKKELKWGSERQKNVFIVERILMTRLKR